MAVGTPLHKGYCFSYMRRGKAAAAPAKGAAETAEAGTAAAAAETTAAHPYENSIKTINTVNTVEEFWETYDFLKRPNDLPTTTDYHFFRAGIKPVWEDIANAKGGKWIVRLPKGLASRYWEETMLALIGGQFTGVPDGEICGAVLSIRYNEDIIAVWTRNATDQDVIPRIRDAIKKILQLPAHASLEYKPHEQSLQDKSSFRNTQAWKPKSLESRGSQGADRETTSSSRRSGSWGERENKPKSRDTGRWR